MLRRVQKMSLLAGCLVVSNCAVSGDFCDVVRGPITFQPETAAQIVRTDRLSAEAIDVQNGYGFARCGWD